MSPIERSTGMPLPILSDTQDSTKINGHHAFYYARDYKYGSEGLKAVRHSRVQRVNARAHAVHHKEFDGTAFPTTEEQEYELTVLSLAGYIPPFGEKITGIDVNIVELSKKERHALRREDTFMSVYDDRHALKTVGQFLMNYALSQEFDDVKTLQVEEFLSITSEMEAINDKLRSRKYELGMKLANKAIGIAVDPINPVFKEARKNYLLRRRSPVCAWKVVKNILNGREPDYFELLESQLTTQFA